MNIAIIGTGYIAGRHAQALATHSDCTIVGHVDVTREAAQKAADAWGGRAYDSVESLLENEHIDAAWVCVPPFAHGDIEKKFTDRRIPMYIEKPIAADMARAEEVRGYINDSGTLVNVGYYWRCIEVVTELKKLLEATPPRFIRAAWHGVTPGAMWWQKQAMSGGQVIEQATHFVDFMRYIMGDATVAHAAANFYERSEFPGMDVATTTTATLEFDGGVLGVLTATCVLDSTKNSEVEFYCDGRKITLTREDLIIETAEGKLVTPIGRDPLAIADEQFITAITQNDAALLPCSYHEALRTQKLCFDIQQTADIYRLKGEAKPLEDSAEALSLPE